jgi:hypothetical protein
VFVNGTLDDHGAAVAAEAAVTASTAKAGEQCCELAQSVPLSSLTLRRSNTPPGLRLRLPQADKGSQCRLQDGLLFLALSGPPFGDAGSGSCH